MTQHDLTKIHFAQGVATVSQGYSYGYGGGTIYRVVLTTSGMIPVIPLCLELSLYDVRGTLLARRRRYFRGTFAPTKRDISGRLYCKKPPYKMTITLKQGFRMFPKIYSEKTIYVARN